MKAGRQLDALVAEKVMGWNINHHGEWIDKSGDYSGWHTNDSKYDPCFNCGRSKIWAPSKDIAAAWSVVEKLLITVAVPGSLDGEGCTFSQYTGICRGDKGEMIYEWGDSAPHAICLAALKAVGAL